MDIAKKKKIILLISVITAAILLAGCASLLSGPQTGGGPDALSEKTAKFNGIDVSRPVKLQMYLIGDKPADTDMVYAEVNKLLSRDINATLGLSFLSWGEWQQKYPVLFASSENFDLIYTATWAQYSQMAGKGAFLELTEDMLAQYAPQTSRTMYPAAWEQARINGKVYMLPMNYKEILGVVTMLRGDIMEKYGVKIPQKYTDLADYYDACLKIPGMTPNDMGSDMDWFAMPEAHIPFTDLTYLEAGGTTGQYYFNPSEKNTVKVVDYYGTENYLNDALLTKEWADRGYWQEKAMVNKTPRKDSFAAGTSGMVTGNLSTINGIYPSIAAAHSEWKVMVVDTYFGEPPVIKSYMQNGVAISRNSKNPERALMLLDLFRNDRRYYDLTFYGIEGRHYKLSSDDNSIIPLADNAGYPPEGSGCWGWRDDTLNRPVEGGIPNYAELAGFWAEKAAWNKAQGFNFDDTKVKNEMAAVSELQNSYGKAIDYGFVDNVNSAVADFRDRLKKAGRDRITEELQRQLDVFMQNN